MYLFYFSWSVFLLGAVFSEDPVRQRCSEAISLSSSSICLLYLAMSLSSSSRVCAETVAKSKKYRNQDTNKTQTIKNTKHKLLVFVCVFGSCALYFVRTLCNLCFLYFGVILSVYQAPRLCV